MKPKFYDIVVAKEYEVTTNGTVEKKTVWNKVGRAWPSKSKTSLNFELYLIPGQRYFISMTDNNESASDFETFENTTL